MTAPPPTTPTPGQAGAAADPGDAGEGAPRAGLAAIISGPSGVGKTTIRQALIDGEPDRYVKSVSATTRPPRDGEVHGLNYFFLATDEFERGIAAGDFLEHAEYQGRYYGTPLSFIRESIAAGKVVLLDIEVQGMQQIVESADFPVVSIFVAPPSPEALIERLRGRGSETDDEIAGRLTRARHEMALAPLYDHVVVNEDLDRAVAEVKSLIDAAR
jgi:guanylate kinase